MPANEAHKKDIIGSIDYIFENYFAATEEAFLKQVAEIKVVLANDVKAKDIIKNNDALSILWRAFYEPQTVFFRLEDKGPISYGDIQIVILKWVVDKINQANETLDISPEAYGWDLPALKGIARGNLAKPFLKSQRAPTNAAVTHLEAKQSPTKVYSFSVEEQKIQFTYHVIASLTVTLPKKDYRKHQIDLGAVPFRFADGEDDFTFMQRKIKEAFPLAEAKTAEVVVTYLRDKKLIPAASEQKISEGGSILLTHEFFFCRVYQKKTLANEFHDLSREEAAVLMDVRAIKLLRERGCTIAQVRRLTLPRLQLIFHPCFDALIRKNQLTIDQVIAWSPELFKVYSTAVVINLLSANLVTLKQVEKASSAFLEIMQCQNYSSLVFSKKIAVDMLLAATESQKTNLLNPRIMQLVESGIVPIEQAMVMPAGIKDILVHEKILPQVQQGKISFAQVTLITTRVHDASEADLNSLFQKIAVACKPVLTDVSLKVILMRYFLNQLARDIARVFPEAIPKELEDVRNKILTAEAKPARDAKEMDAELIVWSDAYRVASQAFAGAESQSKKLNAHKRNMEAPQLLFSSGGNKRLKDNSKASVNVTTDVAQSERLNGLMTPLFKIADFVVEAKAAVRLSAR